MIRFLNFARSHLIYYHPRLNFMGQRQMNWLVPGNNNKSFAGFGIAAVVYLTSWYISSQKDSSLTPDYKQFPYDLEEIDERSTWKVAKP